MKLADEIHHNSEDISDFVLSAVVAALHRRKGQPGVRYLLHCWIQQGCRDELDRSASAAHIQPHELVHTPQFRGSTRHRRRDGRPLPQQRRWSFSRENTAFRREPPRSSFIPMGHRKLRDAAAARAFLAAIQVRGRYQTSESGELLVRERCSASTSKFNETCKTSAPPSYLIEMQANALAFSKGQCVPFSVK